MVEIRSVISWIVIVMLVAVFFPLVAIGFCLDFKGRYAHRMIRAWGSVVMRILRAKVVVEGGEHLDSQKPYVIVSNHESNVDVMILLVYLPLDLKFASKRSLLFVPFMGWAMALARYIFIQRGQGPERAKRVVRDMVRKVQQGFSVLLFPEGTRSIDGNMRPFKKGAFHLAGETGTDILPCAVVGSREALGKGEWRIRDSRVLLMIGKPISANAREVAATGHETVDEKRIDALAQAGFDTVYALRQRGREIFSEKVMTK